ncbi:MAG: phytoene/squalene synthase family protein [Saprospiraceae bacterium]
MNTQLDLFHKVSSDFSRLLTRKYSTSFSLAIRLLAPGIRQDIYNIYGFVRMADEIVDTFHDYPKEYLLNRLEEDVFHAITNGISVNPALNSFQKTVRRYNITKDLIDSFLFSMRLDLQKQTYGEDEYRNYIYGSADVVGLMCLKVFVDGNDDQYEKLKPMAMCLGSAFQKVNFLRDFNMDVNLLDRSYFPGVQEGRMSSIDKAKIIEDVKNDFREARKGIKLLPNTARLGVLTAYRYYMKLLHRLEKLPTEEIQNQRVRVPDLKKLLIIATSYLIYKFSLKEEAW